MEIVYRGRKEDSTLGSQCLAKDHGFINETNCRDALIQHSPLQEEGAEGP